MCVDIVLVLAINNEDVNTVLLCETVRFVLVASSPEKKADVLGMAEEGITRIIDVLFWTTE